MIRIRTNGEYIVQWYIHSYLSYYAKAWQVFNPNRPLDCYTLMKPSFCHLFKNKGYYHHNANDLFEFNLFSDFQLPFAHRSPFFCSIVMTNILVVATSKVWWCDNKVLMIRQQSFVDTTTNFHLLKLDLSNGIKGRYT